MSYDSASLIAGNANRNAMNASRNAEEAAEIAALACNKIDAVQSWASERFNTMWLSQNI